jgi:nucleotide-binding universal stress UspA family protein
MRRILVPTDFSDASRPAIHYALALTAAVKGDLLLLHVVEGDPLPRYVVGETPDMFPSLMDFTGRRFQGACSPTIIRHDRCEEARWKLASLLPAGCPERFRPLVTVGKAAAEIVRVATDQQVDLILLGIQRQRRWRHVLRPTVPTRVMCRTSIPVMLLCTVGRCLLPAQRMHAGGQRRKFERQQWPIVDVFEDRSDWRNTPPGEYDHEPQYPSSRVNAADAVEETAQLEVNHRLRHDVGVGDVG